MQMIVIAVFVVAWSLNCKTSVEKMNLFGKIIKPFYQISIGVYIIIKRFFHKFSYIKKLEERLHVLYPNYEPQKLVKQYICYKIMYALILLFCGNLISLGFSYQENAKKEETFEVERDSYWGDEREEELQVSIDGEIEEETIIFKVKEQQHTKEELRAILEEKALQLETLILNENESLDYVTTDLKLIQKIPNTGIKVFWELDSYEVIEYDGKLCEDALTKEGTLVLLTATLSYQEESYLYSFYANIYEPELTRQQEYQKALLEEIKLRNEDTSEKSSLNLPETLDGKQIHYKKETVKYGNKIGFVALLLSFLIFFVKDEKLEKELTIRKKQMLLDYPEIVSKLTLLLGAGMTIRGALEKIASDYVEKRKGIKQEPRYAYDELLFVCREMQGGLSERQGIDRFGKRCQIQCYMKLSTLLMQNLKKGSRGLAEVLSYEVSEAFEKRKNLARKAGEEAGTKLLASMMLMLLVVLVILIVPACLAF